MTFKVSPVAHEASCLLLKEPLGVCGAGLAAGCGKCHRWCWGGFPASHQIGASGVHQDNADLDLATLGRVLHRKDGAAAGCTERGLYTGKMATIPPVLTLIPHNSVSLYVYGAY